MPSLSLTAELAAGAAVAQAQAKRPVRGLPELVRAVTAADTRMAVTWQLASMIGWEYAPSASRQGDDVRALLTLGSSQLLVSAAAELPAEARCGLALLADAVPAKVLPVQGVPL
eukprot:CAMPEP_0178430826 /NCGR_PEP_ID=MMETSP0689_2-20121128/31522_1 /TAXON_ID=160604 /ORGANISM="Amphidinium massartii, Strain CS-259" /LENGTH=113 /DNA_ID=CAMNT_0020052699 /DNA_START=605 /DNA_END=946 /DNA_ORIENTATION=-